MSAGLDGDVKIGVDLKTKSASKAVESLRKKIRDGLSGQDAKGLEQTIKNTERNIKSLEKEIEKTKSKIQDLMQGETDPKSIKTMEKELQQTEKEIDKVVKQLDALAEERKFAEASRPIGLSNEDWGKMPEGKRSNDITEQMIPLNQEFGKLVSKSEELKARLAQLKANPQLTEEGKKYNRELDEATAELENQKKKLQELKSEQGAFNKAVGGSDGQFKGLESNLRRIKELIKSAFVFSVITKGATLLRESIGKIVKQNTALQSSLNQIKGNLLTAFAPIWQTIIPWLQAFFNMLAKVTAYIAAFINMLMGKSVKASQAAAKALQEQANATDVAGKSAEEAEKSNLSFDTLNTISTSTESGSGGGSGASSPAFKTSDVQITDELMERLKAILVLVGSIGGALLAWKITDFITTLSAGGKEAEALMGKFKMVGGILMIIAGAILLVKNYCDAWVNGLDWGNFLGIIAGLALVVGGLVLVLGASVAPFALIGAGIAALVLGIKDFIENGATFQNILLIIIGLATIFAAVWLLSSGPIALVVAAIVALIAIFVLLWNKCEGFREFWIGLWEKIKETATDLWKNTLKPIWEDHLKPALEAIWQKIQELWEQVIHPIVQKIGEILTWLWNNILKPVIDWVVGVFVKLFQNAWENIKQAIAIAAQFIGGIIDSIKQIFNGIIDFIVGVFTGDWKKAWEGLKSVFKGIINGIITIFEGMINFIINGINKFIGGLDAVVSKVGEIFGAEWSVAKIPTVTLPRLAKGAVLPPNKPFAAIVGDQKHGTNIEAPLETIVQAVKLALGDYEGGVTDVNVNFTGDLAQLAKILNPVIEKEKRRKGPSLVKGGAY